jgi:hypothetical protein
MNQSFRSFLSALAVSTGSVSHVSGDALAVEMSHQMLAGCLIGKPVWRLDVTEVTFCWDSRGVA